MSERMGMGRVKPKGGAEGCGKILGQGYNCDPSMLCESCQQVVRSQARDARALALLKRIEWESVYGRGSEADSPACPECCRLLTKGHAPDCELAALIRELSD